MNALVIGSRWTCSNHYEVQWRDHAGARKAMPFSTRIGAERYTRFLSFKGLSGSLVVIGEAML